ncbi:MAG: AraC family transcriptional regulator [Candidatus Pedobacter colombiensis]|uniref:AraC family transcriptional regulator n=1 Tax=Candidatus Pedobacter colombiensis TaxID=3121371 RepID=A0AAJ5W5C7_9SPHI|nr:AraC family transcriptional regulator [Pedobacter sp.]WEK18262.1 MAG: AraC family transcriptional regulator [Pedobacter sp.]
MEQVLRLNKGNYSGTVQLLKEYAGFITSKTAYTDCQKEFHYHENPHLSFILQGGNIEYKQKETSIKNIGDILFYHSGELHKTLPLNDKTCNFNLEIDASFLKENSLSEYELYKSVARIEYSRLFMLKVYSDVQLNDTLTAVSIHSLLLGFIKNTSVGNYQDIKWCQQLREILNDEWSENHSLAELSKRLTVHPVTISRYFTKYFGCTYGDYVRRLRISKSLPLIRLGNRSLTEIAIICGFADQSHFIRVFKHYTGINPKHFQKL